MKAVPPSSPSRRHFIGIAAATARKLSMITVGSSALSLLGTRDAAADIHEHHHWPFHFHRHREFGDIGHGHGAGFGQGSGSGSGAGQARSSGRRSGVGGGSGSSGSGSGSANGSGSAGSGSGSAGGSGADKYGSGSGTGSGSTGTGTGSGSSGSGSGSGYGTGFGGSGSGDGYGSGSGGYGSASGYGSGSGGIRCFARGTQILTTSGEVAVEHLAVGAEIVTANGPKPVKWIGRQTLKRNPSAAWHPRVLPVCVFRGAIDECTPRRDVYVSQDHALFIDGVLIPARHLVNGHSIRFDETALASETLEYFHVELETHEVIYAGGLPVESFLYSGGMISWDNFEEYLQAYGEHRIMSPLAPIHSYEGGFDELRGLIRLAASRLVDVRDPIQIAHDRLKERALLRAA